MRADFLLLKDWHDGEAGVVSGESGESCEGVVKDDGEAGVVKDDKDAGVVKDVKRVWRTIESDKDAGVVSGESEVVKDGALKKNLVGCSLVGCSHPWPTTSCECPTLILVGFQLRKDMT